MEPSKRLYVVLCEAGTAAIDDLLSARPAETQKNKAGEVNAEKRKNFEAGSNQAAKKSCDAVPPALDFDFGCTADPMHGRVGATYEKAWGCREPFLLLNNERVSRFLDKEEVKTSAREFVDTFATSPIRVAEGRAKKPLPQDMGHDFAVELEPLLMNHEISVDIAKCAATLDGCAEWDELARATWPKWNAMVAGTTSVGVIEWNGLACFRINMHGLRDVVLVDSQAVVAFMKTKGGKIPAEPTVAEAPNWLTFAFHDDLREFCACGHRLYSASCKVGDLLYIPAGYVYCHRVASHEDVVAIRIGALCLGDEIPSGMFQDCYVKNGQTKEALTQALTFLELRKTVSPPSDDTAGQVHEVKSDVATASRGDKSDAATASREDSPSRAN